MIKPDLTSTLTTPDISHIVLLIYSTWLVVGGWLIFTGVQLIYQGSNGEHLLFNYLLGAIRLLAGANAWRTARSVALKSEAPQGAFIRLMASVLVTIMFVLPLLLFIFHTLASLFGSYEPGELYRENIIRLAPIAVGYMLAIIYADWRLRKYHLEVKQSLDT